MTLRWTSDPPKVPGWYWNRHLRLPDVLDTVEVRLQDGVLVVLGYEEWEPISCHYGPADQWAGPIQTPE